MPPSDQMMKDNQNDAPSVKILNSQTLVPLLLMLLTIIGLNIGMNTLLLPSKKKVSNVKPVTTSIASNPDITGWTSLMPKDTDGLGEAWGVISGKWIMQGADFVQTQSDRHDMTMSYRAKMFSNFALRVNIKHDQGSGGGVLINMPDVTRIKGAHLIRFLNDGQGLFWGYFDDNSTFVGQGAVEVVMKSTTVKTLEVHSTTNAYSIWLDGELMAKDVPLRSRNGYVAVINSVSVARFSNVEITSLENTADPANRLKVEPHQ